MCADVWAIIISTLGRQDIIGRILLVIFQDTPERHLRDSDSELCLKLIFVIIVIFHNPYLDYSHYRVYYISIVNSV